MIRYDPKDWFKLIFHSYSRYTMKRIFPALFIMTVYSAAVVFLIERFDPSFKSTTEFHSILGIVLGLFLVFRMNSAYDRWWEGRIAWGDLVNNTRNMALKVAAFLPEDDKESRKFFAKMIPNYVIALKEHLRQGVLMEELEFVSEEDRQDVEAADHKPNRIAYHLYKRVNDLYLAKSFTGKHFWVVDEEIKTFTDILGRCERIKNTPIPYSYSMYLKKFIFTYTITLPFGFVTDFVYLTIPIVVLLFFILVSIELIAEEIEDPFGRDVNDLPTDDLSVKIKTNIEEILKT